MLTLPGVNAQNKIPDSTTYFPLKEIYLTPEQKTAIKQLIWEYKLQDWRRRRHLRHRIFVLLNSQQQNAVRGWWRKQLKK
jgi:hypothetical protein